MRAALWRSVDLSITFYHGEAVLAMDTNQIAAAVQDRQADVLELWAAVRRFAYRQGNRWYLALGNRAGMEPEDFEQVAFLALLDALEGWEPGEWSFLTVYGTTLKAAFAAATGQRTQRDKRDPLQTCVSLDTPIEEGDALTLADALTDPAAERAIEDIAERDRRQRLHHALHRALQTLPETQRRAVVGRYLYGMKTDARACGAGLKALRHPRISRELRVYM